MNSESEKRHLFFEAPRTLIKDASCKSRSRKTSRKRVRRKRSKSRKEEVSGNVGVE